jgi:iron-sulfur cluster assembly accessory protein
MTVPGGWFAVEERLTDRRTHPRSTQMTVQDQTTEQPQVSGVLLTDEAASKVKSLLEQEGRDDLALRVAVQPGGCSGLRYQLFFDERTLDGDLVTDFGGVGVVVDRMSSPYLSGATIDFVDTIEKQGFTIDNPNAGGSCACGDSFH